MEMQHAPLWGSLGSLEAGPLSLDNRAMEKQ